ncbi:MAG: monovalent cation/H+ antiporter subunit D family protein [Rhizobiaceae bacterium]|nr:monovalent cation/H+ antiporter subunit D family protein [Hyphomicrobiales bacterium]NRB30232.1 monovalent cation/H+ antiporter subunit D family protein [Rhizobiaceae bacterium]
MMALVENHAPILVILIPLLAAPLAMLFGNKGLAFLLSLAASVASFLLSVYLLLLVRDGTVLSYHIGGWAPPLGIEYRVDAANALVLLIVSALSAVVLPFARTSIATEIAEKHHTLFYACFMLCFTGLMGVTITGDAFNVFVFLEVSSLSTYVLVALGAEKDRRALSAAYDYLILGTIGATFFVIGLGLIYMATGTLNMVDLAERLSTMESNRTVRSAFAFIVIGLGLKLAIYPLHRWLPGAYTYAPSAVSAFLAATATKVAIYAVLRFMMSVFSIKFGFEQDTMTYIIFPFAIIAMFAASLIAVYQINVKRMLAYSSIAQIGYMLLGIALFSTTGLSATLVHLFNHAVTKGALFLAVGAIIFQIGSPLMANMAGMGKKMPWTSAAIVIGGLSLIGVPGTVGFVSKWVLLTAALENGLWPISLAIVLSSLIAVVYVWKFVELLYLAPIDESVAAAANAKEVSLSMLVPMWILVLVSVWFGFDAEFTVQVANQAADSLFNGGFLKDAVIVGGEGR